MATLQTVTGPIDSAQLGRTLVHEHLLIGYPGWWMDGLSPRFERAEAMARAVDTLQRLRDHGVRSFIDPCPMDLGRDVSFMAECARRSGMQIICTTGAYTEKEGIPYTFGAMSADEIAATYVRELTEGIGDTGIRAGLIKLATGAPEISAYEQKLAAAAGMAAAEVGCAVITHTDHASCGQEQLDLLGARGVAPHRVLVGHSDGRDDHDYHRALADRGAYVGFDRFGIEPLIPDAVRIACVAKMVQAGYARSVCISHDATCGAWLGRPVFGGRFMMTPEQIAQAMPNSRPTHIFEHVIPALLQRGVTAADIDTMLVDNPRRYLEGSEPPR